MGELFSEIFMLWACLKSKILLAWEEVCNQNPRGLLGNNNSCLISASVGKAEQTAVPVQVLSTHRSSTPSLLADFPLGWQSLQHLREERGNCLG